MSSSPGKLDEWFDGRRWRVTAELDGERTVEVEGGDGNPVPVEVRFRKGRFSIDPPGSFVSPLGSRGRTGVLLQEVDADGKDIPDSVSAWGESMFRKAKEEFHAIV